MKLEKEKMLADLVRSKIRLHPSILMDMGKTYRFHPVFKGGLFKIYEEFNGRGLEMAYKCFITKESDPTGKCLEYRFAQWLAKKHKKIKAWIFRRRFSPIGEIDIVGYDENDRIIVVAECKCRKGKAKKQNLDKWIANVKLIKQKDVTPDLKVAYFVNLAGYTQEVLDRLFERSDITSDFKLKTGLAERVELCLCEERDGKIRRVV